MKDSDQTRISRLEELWGDIQSAYTSLDPKSYERLEGEYRQQNPHGPSLESLLSNEPGLIARWLRLLDLMEDSQLADPVFVQFIHGQLLGALEGIRVIVDRYDPKTSLPQDKQILIVDDDESLLDLLTTVLSNAGLNTLTAASAKSAIAFLAKSPDLVLLDLNLAADQSGLSVLREMRLPGIIPVPVIVLTGLAVNTPMVWDATQQPNIYLMAKPFNSAELLRRIHLLLNTHPLKK